jgi:hypothetical protein
MENYRNEKVDKKGVTVARRVLGVAKLYNFPHLLLAGAHFAN